MGSTAMSVTLGEGARCVAPLGVVEEPFCGAFFDLLWPFFASFDLLEPFCASFDLLRSGWDH